MSADPHYWTAYLAASIREALKDADLAHSHLTQALRRFMDSDACTPELEGLLREERHGRHTGTAGTRRSHR